MAAITFLGKKAFTPKCKPSIYHAVSLPKLYMLRFPHVGKINAYLPLTHLILFLFMYTTTLSFTDMNCGLSRRQALGFPGGPVVRFCTSNAGGAVWIPGCGTKIPPAVWYGQKKKKKETKSVAHQKSPGNTFQSLPAPPSHHHHDGSSFAWFLNFT